MTLATNPGALMNVAWTRLSSALATYALPIEGGKYRTGATADEFMLMEVREEDCGWREAAFKHIDSRNYLLVRWCVYSDGVTLRVPCGGAFLGGVFPAPVTLAA